jgi:SAM-dependent methyltransferase
MQTARKVQSLIRLDPITSTATRLGVAAQLIRNVYRRHGLIEMANLALHELFFDLYNGTSTAIDLDTLYESSNPLLFQRLIGRMPEEAKKGTFLDCGSGKGRALMLAVRHGFKKGLGVEISPRFCALAEQNIAIYLAQYPGCSISIRNEDAQKATIPDEVAVLYLYHPFGPETVQAVIDHLCGSLRRRPRSVWVVYLVPMYGDLFLRRGFTSIFNQAGFSTIFHWSPHGRSLDSTK